MIGNNIHKLTSEDLKDLSTKRLLNIKRIAYPHIQVSDDYVWDCECTRCAEEKHDLRYWQKMVDNIKSILTDREHIEPKGKRQKKA